MAATSGETPWLDAFVNSHDVHVAIDEYGIDRKAHEHHVNRRAWSDPQSLVLLQRAPAKQPSHAREHRSRNGQLLHNDIFIVQQAIRFWQVGRGFRHRPFTTTRGVYANALWSISITLSQAL